MFIKRFLKLFVILLSLVGSVFSVPQWHDSKDGNTYLIEGEEKYNWLQASDECARRDLQLAVIDTEEKNINLVAVLKANFGGQGQNKHLWFGAHDQFNKNIDRKRPFYWSATGQIVSYADWAIGQPDNLESKEHCLQYTLEQFKWNDVHCDYTSGFICEEKPINYKKLVMKVIDVLKSE